MRVIEYERDSFEASCISDLMPGIYRADYYGYDHDKQGDYLFIVNDNGSPSLFVTGINIETGIPDRGWTVGSSDASKSKIKKCRKVTIEEMYIREV